MQQSIGLPFNGLRVSQTCTAVTDDPSRTKNSPARKCFSTTQGKAAIIKIISRKGIKIIVPAVFFLQLLAGFAAQSQNQLREGLRQLENGSYPQAESRRAARKAKKHRHDCQTEHKHLSAGLDSLIDFVKRRRRAGITTFENDIAPYLQATLSQDKLLFLHFTDEESLLLDSFLRVVTWENIDSTVLRYRDFILSSGSTASFSSVLALFCCLREVNDYVFLSRHGSPNAEIVSQMREAFMAYNHIDWLVFAKQPDAMVFWLAASCAWNSR